MRRKLKNLIYLCMALLVCGCSINWVLAGRSVPTVEETTSPVRATTMTTDSQVETQPVTKTPLPQIDKQPTDIVTDDAPDRCPIINDTLPDNLLRPGKIVYMPGDSDPSGNDSNFPGLMAIDPLTNNAYAFPEATDCCSYIFENERLVSRDRKWVALEYENYDKKQFGYLITNADNTSMYMYLRESKTNPWQYLLTWLNEGRMVLYPLRSTPEYPNEFLVDNPFTNQKKEVQLHLPGLFSSEEQYEVIDWYYAFYPSFDPMMTRAVYFKQENPLTINKEIVLWDMEEDIPLWRYPMITPFADFISSEPQWASDGSWFITVLSDQMNPNRVVLMRVFRDGREEILRAGVLGKPQSVITGASISPDQRYISFFVLEDGKHHLYILDLDRNEIWDPCIVGSVPSNVPIYSHTKGVWSPDNRQLIVSMDIDRATTKNIVDGARFLIDIENKEIYRFDRITSPWFIWLAP